MRMIYSEKESVRNELQSKVDDYLKQGGKIEVVPGFVKTTFSAPLVTINTFNGKPLKTLQAPKPSRYTTAERDKWAAQHVEQGMTPRQIAAATGVAETTIVRELKARKVFTPKNIKVPETNLRIKIDDQTSAEIVDMFLSGISGRKISDKLNVSYSIVQRELSLHGVSAINRRKR